MRLTPDTRDFKFLEKVWKVLEIFCRAQKKFFLKWPEKSLSKIFFWKNSKSKQRRLSECRLCLDLENFQNFPKNFFAQNFFQGISRRNFFWPYKKFPTLFKNLKLRVSGVERIFFSFSFLYPGQIPIKLMESACKKKFTRLTLLSTHPQCKPLRHPY